LLIRVALLLGLYLAFFVDSSLPIVFCELLADEFLLLFLPRSFRAIRPVIPFGIGLRAFRLDLLGRLAAAAHAGANETRYRQPPPACSVVHGCPCAAHLSMQFITAKHGRKLLPVTRIG
jgi:hypothetical protein